jgi:Flp pilus assembly protein TadD
LEKAKAALPKSVPIDLELARLDIQQSKFDEASKRLHALLVNDPESGVAHLWLGNLAATRGDRSAATEEYRKAVEIDGQNASALNNLAYMLSEYGGSQDEALKMAQKAKELAPDNPAYADTLGWVLYRKGLYPGALTELRRAASGVDAKPEFEYHLAMAYLKTGDRSHAQAGLAAALKKNPKYAEAKAAQEQLLHSK